MSDTPEFEDLIKRLRALLVSEYQRGQADAARRIIEAAEAQVRPTSSDPPRSAERTNGAHRPPRRRVHLEDDPPSRRAPTGAPDALVRRVLMERGSQGASSREIETAAQSDFERMVSQSGIRFALDRGKNAGKYRNERGLWFLVEEETKN